MVEQKDGSYAVILDLSIITPQKLNRIAEVLKKLN